MHIWIVEASLAVSARGYVTTSRPWLSSDTEGRTDHDKVVLAHHDRTGIYHGLAALWVLLQASLSHHSAQRLVIKWHLRLT